MPLFTANQLFRALSDETRLYATLMMLDEGELCVCELMAALCVSQPKVSRHLAQLRSLGLLTDVRRGQWVYYSLANNLPNWVLDALQAASQAEKPAINTCKKNLASMINRPTCC